MRWAVVVVAGVVGCTSVAPVDIDVRPSTRFTAEELLAIDDAADSLGVRVSGSGNIPLHLTPSIGPQGTHVDVLYGGFTPCTFELHIYDWPDQRGYVGVYRATSRLLSDVITNGCAWR
jgi:hypothetical protein